MIQTEAPQVKVAIVRRRETGEQQVFKGDQLVATIRRLSARLSRASGGPPYGHWALISTSGRVDRNTSMDVIRELAISL